MDNLGAILIGVASLFSIGVVFAVATKVFSGSLVPVAVRHLVEELEKRNTLLETQNDALIKERAFEKEELRNELREATKAIFAVEQFLTRYEQIGGLVDYSRSLAKTREREDQV